MFLIIRYKVFGYSAINAYNAPTYAISGVLPNTMKSVNTYISYFIVKLGLFTRYRRNKH